MFDLIDTLNVEPGGSRIGVVRFSNAAQNVFFLNTYSEKADIMRAIQLMPYGGGKTNTSGGLRLMREQQFRVSNGDRRGVLDMAIVITDGVSTVDAELTIPEAEAARASGIQILAIGITNSTDEEELKSMSSRPQHVNRNYFNNADFRALSTVVDSVSSQICPEIPQVGKGCSLESGIPTKI